MHFRRDFTALLTLILVHHVFSAHAPINAKEDEATARSKRKQPLWSETKCSLKLAGNTGYTNLQMWEGADAAGAWDYVSKLPYDGSMSWTSFVARELGFLGWQAFECQGLTGNNCEYQQNCISPVNPGGWMVINSIANLWGYHWDLWSLIGTARSQIDVDIVITTFSPQLDAVAVLAKQMFLTNLLLGMTLLIGVIFNIGAEFAITAFDLAREAAVAAKEEELIAGFVKEGLTKEEATAKAAEQAQSEASKKYQKSARSAALMMSWQASSASDVFAISSARNALGSAEDGLAAENVLTDLVANTTNLWQTSESTYVSQLFNGSKSNIEIIGNAIADGNWLSPWNQTTSKVDYTPTVLQMIKKQLYGMMIPVAWSVQTKSKSPFMPVLIVADGCVRNITDTKPPKRKSSIRFDKGIDSQIFCFEDKTFWLLTPYHAKHKKIHYQLPSGLGSLTGANDTFGGLSVPDMIISSYYAWGNNSYVNPAPKPDPKNVLNQTTWGEGVRYPGFFNWPVCVGWDGLEAAARSYKAKQYKVPC